eukprot:GHRR01001387.1.p1 GENE.GHRR01001387.1~~GHRR01001387.1.p1  ORF type:complete len:544 (+),score=208.12 GHRR01001387.1:96-1727(+)
MADQQPVSAWGIKPGMAWAEEVEQEEASRGPVDEEAFPSLGEAIKASGQKTAGKKGKPVKMGLGEFFSAPVGRRPPQSDKEILLQLPKGSSGLPREERDPNALGGGFKDYGGNREGGGLRGRREGEEREPSRADAASDWGSTRKFTPSEPRSSGSGGFGFRDRAEGGFGDRRGLDDRPRREERPVSEADVVDDWGANRKFTPSSDADRSRGFGSSFASSNREGGGFRDRPRFADEPSRADAGDWGSRRGPSTEEQPGPSGRRAYGFSEQPVSQADAEDRWSRRAQPPAEAPSSSTGPAERPRLKLQPRTKPLDTPPADNGVARPSTPSSEAGSASGQQPQQQSSTPKKSNPFGAARPREEVLKEKGIDYQKQQLKLEHGEVLRDKTSEEEEMEKEVEELRVRLEGMREITPGETDTIEDLVVELDEREKALYKLQAELDDKVRYSKSRPGRERSSTPAGRNTAAAAAEDDTGFEVVRNPRKERPAQAAADSPSAEGSNAWQRGRGGFRDRDGSREGSGTRGGNRDSDRRSAGSTIPGRSGLGW